MIPLILTRLKVLAKRSLATVGVREDVGLIPVAVLIGILTSLLAVAFHSLVEWLKDRLYVQCTGQWLYEQGLWMLVVIPASGGLAVGIITRYLLKSQGGHGVVDVIESVLRTRGFVKPIRAIEKIITSGLTLGSGGSTGAEGPIVEIGAAVSSGVGNLLSISRQRMPLLVGCGAAAGISSIFHAPIGGVLFTLEVILRDFSVRTFVPVVVASVIANVTTQSIMEYLSSHHGLISDEGYHSIFWVPYHLLGPDFSVTWIQGLQFAILGLFCGILGVTLTHLMLWGEQVFRPLQKLGAFRPMLGGALLGGMGILYLWLSYRFLGVFKPLSISDYPMPAFFGDGYGVIQTMLSGSFGHGLTPSGLMVLLVMLLIFKLLGTTVTLCSGGSGGVIAPSLVLGATGGLLLGNLLNHIGVVSAQPGAMTLVGMGAVLSAVIHAPLASILIVFELTQSPGVIVPAMLACVVAQGTARLMHPDSVYTEHLRKRGVRPESSSDMSSLRKYAIDHLPMEPILPLRLSDPFKRVIDLATQTDRSHFVVTDDTGQFKGIITSEEVRQVLLEPQAIPLLTVAEVMRTDVQPLRHTENLASLFEAFLVYNIEALPVGLDHEPNRVVGIVSRDSLMKHYQRSWQDS